MKSLVQVLTVIQVGQIKKNTEKKRKYILIRVFNKVRMGNIHSFAENELNSMVASIE